MPTSVIAERQRAIALMADAGSLSAFPSQTVAPSVSTTQIEVVFNDTYAILTWQQELGVEWHYIAPGKPMPSWCA